MPSSTDRKTPEEKAAKIANLKNLPTRDMKDRVAPEDVPRWVKAAMTKVEVLGYSYADAAKEFKRQPNTLSNYARAPYIIEWRKRLREFADDPVAMATAVIRGSVLEAALDQLWAIETAKATGDYKEVRQGTKDILATHNVLQPSNTQKADHRVMISINLGHTDLEAPEATIIEAEFEEIDQKRDSWELPEENRTDWTPIE